MEKQEREPNKRFYEKDRNRFMALRYESDTAEYPTITGRELAKEFSCSPSTISNLEDSNLKEKDVLNKSVGLIKAYHDKFKCSYEYLLGEAKLPDPKYIGIDASPLSAFDSQTLNHLEKLLSDKEFSNFNLYMIEALLANPSEFQKIMNIIFRFLYAINEIYSDSNLNQAEKQLNTSNLWFSLNNHMDVYLKDALLPNLQVGFDRFRKNEAERIEKAKEEAKLKEEQLMRDIDEFLAKENSDDIIEVKNVKVVKVTPIENQKEDGQ